MLPQTVETVGFRTTIYMNIDKIAELNNEYNRIKKELDKAKAELRASGQENIQGNDYVAIIKPRTTTKLDNEKAVSIIKKYKANWLLKEVVDEDKLNDALYQGELDPALFKDCLIEKTNYAVTFRRRKQDA